MAAVSVLIPAFKLEYFMCSLMSACNQNYSDIEILVGDDTVDGVLHPIVEAIADPRVQYFHHGFRDGNKNAKVLWERASGRYVKWLFDDDYLFPDSIGLLRDALERNQGAPLAFHGRIFVNQHGKETGRPWAPQNGSEFRIDRQFLVDQMVANINNFVGEPSNVMLDRERVSFEDHALYGKHELKFLADVALYLNLAEKGGLIAVGGYHSAFRRHSSQNSTKGSPMFSAGLYEWEIFIRGEIARGNLDCSKSPELKNRLEGLYRSLGANLPEIRRLAEHLDDFDTMSSVEIGESSRFNGDIAYATQCVMDRLQLQRQSQQALTTKREACSCCDSSVEGWMNPPYPAPNTSFLADIRALDSSPSQKLCPVCGRSLQEREIVKVLKLICSKQSTKTIRVLGVGCDLGLEEVIAQLAGIHYSCTGDILDASTDIGTFDVVILYHQLDRVTDVQKYLEQVSTLMNTGAALISFHHRSSLLKATLDFSSAPAQDCAAEFFGSAELRRIFGADEVALMRQVNLLPIDLGINSQTFASFCPYGRMT